MNQGAADTSFTQNFCRFLDGITFSNGAQIEHHSLTRKTDRLLNGIELHVAHSDTLAGPFENLRIRNFS